MTTQLRFEVISKIPFANHNIGDIIDLTEKDWRKQLGVANDMTPVAAAAELRECTGNFKELGWHEGLTKDQLSEMAAYIRLNKNWVVRVKRHLVAHTGDPNVPKFSCYDNENVYPYALCTPATREEYLTGLTTSDKIVGFMNAKLKGRNQFWHIEDTNEGKMMKFGMAVQNGRTKASNDDIEKILRDNFAITKVHFTNIGTLHITKNANSKIAKRPKKDAEDAEQVPAPVAKKRGTPNAAAQKKRTPTKKAATKK
jgi:hypothetical protein